MISFCYNWLKIEVTVLINLVIINKLIVLIILLIIIDK